jgi:hypothetical protein
MQNAVRGGLQQSQFCVAVAGALLPSRPEKRITFASKGAKARSCRDRKRDHVSLLCHSWREGHTLRLSNAVLTPQVTVGFHCQRAAVLVSKPARDGWNIHAALYAPRCKQVPQIVMRNAICANLFARSIKSFLAFVYAEYFGV